MDMLHVGGPLNGKVIDVEEISLTRIDQDRPDLQIPERQYILQDTGSMEVYALVGMCHRDVRAAVERWSYKHPERYKRLVASDEVDGDYEAEPETVEDE